MTTSPCEHTIHHVDHDGNPLGSWVVIQDDGRNLAALIIGPWLSPLASTDELQQDIIQIREELAQLK